jgi:peptide/nickel transport system ATP-binding protein
MSEPLLRLDGLVKHFHAEGGRTVRAVDGVSLSVRAGETLGLVGESGCGKSTLGYCMLRLHDPTAGTITFAGHDITHLSSRALRPLRRRMQMVFQDPFSSLNPRRRVGDILGDVMRVHRRHEPGRITAEVGELLTRVGLRASDAHRYPREFSGGQRQRIGIARALAVGPDLIVADEPVSALDVSIQAQIINLLVDLQEELRLTCVFISHDLAVVRQVADRIGVLYLGKLAELAPRDDLYLRPIHPYTEGLLSAVPIADVDIVAGRKRAVPLGDLPDPANPPTGCRFHTRCRYATEVCRTVEPELVDHGGGRMAACHHPLNVDAPAAEPAAAVR